MTTWDTSTPVKGRPSRHQIAPATSLSPVPCAVDAGDALEPRECDAMRYCADPTIRLTLACPAPGRRPYAWHPWEG